MEHKVSIIIPVIRPDKIELCIDAIVQNSGVRMDEYEIITDIDTDGIGCPEMLVKLVERTKHNLVMFLGDDTAPQNDFLKNAIEEMNKLPDGWGVVGLNTQDERVNGGNPFAHWLAHKNILEYIEGGNFFSTDYKHCWCDNELYDIANDMGRWAYAEKSYIKHNHHVNGTNEWDEGYQKAYTEKNQIHDRQTYLKRKIARHKKNGGKLGIGFPITWDFVHKAFFETFTALQKPSNFTLLMPRRPGHIDQVRNDLAEQALDCGCTELFMMDTDQLYRTVDLIPRMVDLMRSKGYKFLSAPVHRRYAPFDHLLLRRGSLYDSISTGDPSKKGDGRYQPIPNEEAYSGEIVEIDATGCGCVLIDTTVFLELEKPWFNILIEAGKTTGEDIYFCQKLREKGHSLFCDTSIDIGHLSTIEINADTHKIFTKREKLLTEEAENG